MTMTTKVVICLVGCSKREVNRAQLKKNDNHATQVQENITEGKCAAGQVLSRVQVKKSDKIHPFKVKEAISSGLLYQNHQETKKGQSSNQSVIPKGFQQQVMSVNHESVFSAHLRAKKTECRILPNFFCPDYARTSLDSAIPVMCAKEKSRRVISRNNF